MVTSRLPRATGIALVAVMLGLVWRLVALASCEKSWAAFATCAGSLLGQLVLFGFSWALAYHLINGVRHLVQDAGHGWSIPEFVRSSWISIIGSVVLVVVVWAIVLFRGGAA